MVHIRCLRDFRCSTPDDRAETPRCIPRRAIVRLFRASDGVLGWEDRTMTMLFDLLKQASDMCLYVVYPRGADYTSN